MHGASGPIRLQRALLSSHRVRTQWEVLSVNQCPHRTPGLLVPWSCTCSLQTVRNKCVPFKSFSLRHFCYSSSNRLRHRFNWNFCLNLCHHSRYSTWTYVRRAHIINALRSPLLASQPDITHLVQNWVPYFSLSLPPPASLSQLRASSSTGTPLFPLWYSIQPPGAILS